MPVSRAMDKFGKITQTASEENNTLKKVEGNGLEDG